MNISGKFRFPTSTKDALELFRLEADVRDRADGQDNVDETIHLNISWIKDVWRHGRTPTVQALANTAANGGVGVKSQAVVQQPGTVSEAPPSSPKPGWQGICDALKRVEKEGPLDVAAVTGALAELGFSRRPAAEKNAGCLVFTHGKRAIGVRLFMLGTIRVAEIAVAGGNKKDGAGHAPEHMDKLGHGTAAVYVAGKLLGKHLWHEVLDKCMDTLTLARDALAAASAAEGAPDLPVEFSALKAFLETAETEAKQAKSVQELEEISARQEKITALWKEMVLDGTAPRGVMLQYDGPDGAGKTSSSKYLSEALLAANDELPADLQWSSDTEIFKQPTDQDEAWTKTQAAAEYDLAPWLTRHVLRGVPAEHQILTKDRFQPGDYVYVGEHTPERLAQMTAEYAKYEQWIADHGIFSFKAILWADQEKQAKTFGKRLGRGAFVDALIAELRARGQLTPEIQANLTEIKLKIEGTDFVGLSTFKKVLPLYQEFAAATSSVVPCPVIEATDRHLARLDLLDRFLKSLQSYHDRARPQA